MIHPGDEGMSHWVFNVKRGTRSWYGSSKVTVPAKDITEAWQRVFDHVWGAKGDEYLAGITFVGNYPFEVNIHHHLS